MIGRTRALLRHEARREPCPSVWAVSVKSVIDSKLHEHRSMWRARLCAWSLDWVRLPVRVCWHRRFSSHGVKVWPESRRPDGRPGNVGRTRLARARIRLGTWPCRVGWHVGSISCSQCAHEDSVALDAALSALRGCYEEGLALQESLRAE